MLCGNQVSKHLHTCPCNCGGMVWCGKYTGLSDVIGMVCLIQSQNSRSSLCKKASGWSLMISINQPYWICVISASCPKCNLKGRQLTSVSKSKTTAFVFGLGPNAGLSLEVGGVILEDVTSTWSNWTLIVLGATSSNNMSMLSPFLSILALYSIWWQSVVNNSAANKGCHTQIFCLVVLIRITGTALAFVVATQLFITILRGRLWCLACSTMHVIFYGSLLVCPRTVIAELPWIQTGFFFEPMVTCPICPSSADLDCWSFLFRQVICLWGFRLFNLLGHDLRCSCQHVVLSCVWMLVDAQLGE